MDNLGSAAISRARKGEGERHHILAHLEKAEAKTILALDFHRKVSENEEATVWKHGFSR